MKKFNRVALLLIALITAFCMTFAVGCGNAHTHSYSSEYKKDATTHWLECSCGDKKDVADHSYTAGKCVCGQEAYTPANQEEQDFLDDIGGVSETYTGTVSEETYTSADDAAEAFIADEIAGEKEATVVSTVSKGTLSESQINDLELSEEDKTGIVSIEEVEIEYSVEDGDAPYAAAASNTKKVKVYIIKYENSFKYISPAPKTGDTVTKSYYDSIFDAESYKNCTMTSEVSLVSSYNVSANLETMSMSSTTTMKQTVKYADGKIHVVIEVSSEYTYDGESDSNDATTEFYLEEVDGIMTCFVKYGDEWMSADITTIGFDSVEELQPFYDDFLDYTYFEKTAYGCTISTENFDRYLKQALFSQENVVGSEYFDQMELNGYAKYFVSNGVLSGALVELDASLDVTTTESGIGMSMSMVMKETAKSTCTNYGTTVIERPAID